MFQNMVSFVRESYQELKKVTWPTRKEILGSSVVVLVVSALFMILIALVDWLIRLGLGVVLK